MHYSLRFKMAAEVNLRFLLIFLYCRQVGSDQHDMQQKSGYIISKETFDWNGANSYCIDNEGTLVEFLDETLTKQAKSEIMRMNPDIPLWLGARSSIGNFMYGQTKIEAAYSAKDTFNSSCLVLKLEKVDRRRPITATYMVNECTRQQELRYICRKTGNQEMSLSNIRISTGTLDWYAARNKCVKEFNGTGDLFFLYKEENLQNLENVLSQEKVAIAQYYIGARRLNWKWTDSSNCIVYANWTNNNQPNETSPACLVVLPDGSLDDVPCDKKFKAFCVGPAHIRNNGSNHPESTSQPPVAKLPRDNLPIWIGVGVTSGVLLVIGCVVGFICYKRKCKCCCTVDKQNAEDQFHYLNNTLEAKTNSIYSNEPTKQTNGVKNINETPGTYETIGPYAPGGSIQSNIPPDVTLRNHPTNRNGVSRNDVYSKVVKNTNHHNYYNNELDTNDPRRSDNINEFDDIDGENDDHDIVDNDLYNFYN